MTPTLTINQPTTHWQTQAACRWEDPDLFFPKSGNPAHALQVERAQAVCRGCPVRRECLDDAEARGECHGVFGGVNFAERAADLAVEEPHSQPLQFRRPPAPIAASDLAVQHGAQLLIANNLDGKTIEDIAREYQTTVYAVRDALRFLEPHRASGSTHRTIRIMRQADRFRALRKSGKSLVQAAGVLGIGRSMAKRMAAMIEQIDVYEMTRAERSDTAA